MIRHLSKPSAKRKLRVRRKILSHTNRPRLTVFRSHKHIYAQIVDSKGKTLVAATESEISSPSKANKTDKAKLVGELLAKKCKKKKIIKVVFDRGAYKYHGRIKALAEAARSQGLKF